MQYHITSIHEETWLFPGGRIMLACSVTLAIDYALNRSFPPSYPRLMQTTGSIRGWFLQELRALLKKYNHII